MKTQWPLMWANYPVGMEQLRRGRCCWPRLPPVRLGLISMWISHKRLASLSLSRGLGEALLNKSWPLMRGIAGSVREHWGTELISVSLVFANESELVQSLWQKLSEDCLLTTGSEHFEVLSFLFFFISSSSSSVSLFFSFFPPVKGMLLFYSSTIIISSISIIKKATRTGDLRHSAHLRFRTVSLKDIKLSSEVFIGIK